MDSYLDTSFLLKFYLTEPDSSQAEQCLRKNPGVRWISALSDLEVITSLSRFPSSIVATREIENYREDVGLGVYRKLELDTQVFAKAEDLAELYARSYKLRSLDILHLATVLRYGVPSIGTYDKRLADAASALGLIVLPGRS